MSDFEHVKGYEGPLPMRGTSKSAGYDLTANEGFVIDPGKRVLVKTGVTVTLEDNEYLAIVPRSGLTYKNGITVLNTPGTIDADYYPGEIGVILYNTGDAPFVVEKGDRIAQAILCEYKTMGVDLVKDRERNGGFGSTGVKS